MVNKTLQQLHTDNPLPDTIRPTDLLYVVRDGEDFGATGADIPALGVWDKDIIIHTARTKINVANNAARLAYSSPELDTVFYQADTGAYWRNESGSWVQHSDPDLYNFYANSFSSAISKTYERVHLPAIKCTVELSASWKFNSSDIFVAKQGGEYSWIDIECVDPEHEVDFDVDTYTEDATVPEGGFMAFNVPFLFVLANSSVNWKIRVVNRTCRYVSCIFVLAISGMYQQLQGAWINHYGFSFLTVACNANFQDVDISEYVTVGSKLLFAGNAEWINFPAISGASEVFYQPYTVVDTVIGTTQLRIDTRRLQKNDYVLHLMGYDFTFLPWALAVSFGGDSYKLSTASITGDNSQNSLIWDRWANNSYNDLVGGFPLIGPSKYWIAATNSQTYEPEHIYQYTQYSDFLNEFPTEIPTPSENDLVLLQNTEGETVSGTYRVTNVSGLTIEKISDWTEISSISPAKVNYEYTPSDEMYVTFGESTDQKMLNSPYEFSYFRVNKKTPQGGIVYFPTNSGVQAIDLVDFISGGEVIVKNSVSEVYLYSSGGSTTIDEVFLNIQGYPLSPSENFKIRTEEDLTINKLSLVNIALTGLPDVSTIPVRANPKSIITLESNYTNIPSGADDNYTGFVLPEITKALTLINTESVANEGTLAISGFSSKVFLEYSGNITLSVDVSAFSTMEGWSTTLIAASLDSSQINSLSFINGTVKGHNIPSSLHNGQSVTLHRLNGQIWYLG